MISCPARWKRWWTTSGPAISAELENVNQGATILADGDSLTRSELPEFLRQLTDEEGAAPGSSNLEGFEGLLRQFKVNLANKAILECNGNKTLAAKKLQVSRAYPHRLIRLGPDELSAVPPTNITPLSGIA
jgi:DNA-binding NtrC family response regulator